MNSTPETPPTALVVQLTPAQQLEQLQKWILAGHSEYDIMEAAAQAFPAADLTTMLRTAANRVAASANPNYEFVLGFAIEATRDLYRRMVEIGDFTGALRALKQLHDFAKNHVCEPEETEADDETTVDAVDATAARSPTAARGKVDGQKRRHSVAKPAAKKKAGGARTV